MARDWEPFSVWDGVYFAPVKAPKSEPVKKEDAGELLRQLIALDDPTMQNVVYVLAVMLERKRILVERAMKTAPDGTLVHIYEHRRSGDILLVADPRLTDAEIPGVQQEIERLLGLRPRSGRAPRPAAATRADACAGPADTARRPAAR